MTAVATAPASVRTPVLNTLLVIVALAILTQAVLAGLFISESAPVKFVHLIVGSALPWFAIAPAVVAWVRAAQRAVPKSSAVLITVLLVGLWAQDALGHIGMPVTAAVHIPLGVVLFAGATWLAIASIRRGRAAG